MNVSNTENVKVKKDDEPNLSAVMNSKYLRWFNKQLQISPSEEARVTNVPQHKPGEVETQNWGALKKQHQVMPTNKKVST